VFLIGAMVTRASGDLIWTMAAPEEAVAPGATVEVALVALNATAEPIEVRPRGVITGVLRAGETEWAVRLGGILPPVFSVPAGGFASLPYVLRLPPEARGTLVLELDDFRAGRAVIEVREEAEPVRPMVTAPVRVAGVPAVRAIERGFIRRFSPHEPVYFILGTEAPAAKFQYSVRYRVLSLDGAEAVDPLHSVQFGFTQRSLWDFREE
jgi:phospholipase A1/A2